MNKRIPIFIANWKMNKFLRDTAAFVAQLSAELSAAPLKLGQDYEVAIAPSSAHLALLASSLEKTGIALGAQNCGQAKFGAFTGEVSPAVLRELGCEWVIVGHSERRHVFMESDSLILSRAKAALAETLKIVFCVGEVIEERKAGTTFEVLERQLASLATIAKEFVGSGSERLILAYEPVWAIGTGENATPDQAQAAHAYLRNWVSKNLSVEAAKSVRILYGGSVKPDNAALIMGQADVDGLLIGTSSLDAAVFAGVIKSGLKSRT